MLQRDIFIKEITKSLENDKNIFFLSADFGAAALDLAFVAAGRYDGFWERGLSLWDIAAGYLLVKEAGGFISDFSARDNCLVSGDVVAANSAMHIPLLKKLRQAKDSFTQLT